MHAYAIEDPIFHAMNKLGLEQTNGLLGEFCVQCHAPIATQMGEAPGGVLNANLSPAGRRGVTCDACHRSEAQSPGHVISKFRLDGVLYGPMNSPDAVPNRFHGSQYHPQIEQSENCSGCHDVINTRNVQVEATYTEWQKSIYPARGIPCQVCHMKWDSGTAAIGSNVKRRVHSHVMAGVDVPLTDFPGRDQMISEVGYLLNNSIHTEFLPPLQINRGQSLPLIYSLTNSITGHNVPSGTIFERQMWVQVEVVNEKGDTLYRSGMLDPNGDLLNDKSDFVKKGTIPYDTALVLFNGTAYRKGVEVPFFFDADAISNHSIPPFETRYAKYLLKPELLASSSTLNVKMRLMMRAIPPYLLRMLGHAALVDKVPVFQMEERTAEISIK